MQSKQTTKKVRIQKLKSVELEERDIIYVSQWKAKDDFKVGEFTLWGFAAWQEKQSKSGSVENIDFKRWI
jgi:hypothetical protein